MAASQELTSQAHTIIRTTIGQYYVNQAVASGVPQDKMQQGSVTFIQRFGSALPRRQEAPLAMVGRNLSGKSRFELFDPMARPCTSMLGKGSRCWISPSEQGI